MVPPQGLEHGDQGDQEPHSPSTAKDGQDGVCWGVGFKAGLGLNSLYCPLCLQHLLSYPPPHQEMSLSSPGQASVKQACDWCCGPGQFCSTGRLGVEQCRFRACVPGPQV